MEGLITTDVTECCICTEMFRDPRILPCLHTFCLGCLDETLAKAADAETRSRDGAMPCPVCRQDFAIPVEGLRGIRKNSFVERLMTIARLSQPIKKKVPCDVCLDNVADDKAEVADASKYCMECRDNLCDSCSFHHTRQKLSRSHQVVLYGSQVREELATKFVAQFCAQHRMEQLKMYCTDCKKVVCIVCFAESHQLHQCVDVHKAAESFRNELEIDLEKVADVFKEGVVTQQELETAKKQILEELASAEKTIIDRATALKKLVEDHLESLLQELAAVKAKQLKVIETKLDEIGSQLVAINSFQTYCCDIKSRGTSGDICSYADDLRTRGRDLSGMRSTRIPPQTPQESLLIRISFAESKLDESWKRENIVGTIKVQTITTETKLETQEANQPVEVNLMKRLSFKSAILGIAKLQNRIHVLYAVNDSRDRYINTIDVFDDEHPFPLLTEVKSKDMRNCRDIVSSDKLNCLFVSDTWNRCILKVSAVDYRVIEWLSKVGESFALSMSSDGQHLLLLRQEQGRLDIYGLDAKLIRSVTLSADILCPMRLTQIDDNHFVVIHRPLDANIGPWVVSGITNDGMIIHQFHPKELLESGSLVTSCFSDFSVDSENQRLFVSDSETVNVIELNLNSLKYIGIVLTKKQNAITSPHRLNYDTKKKMLIVGHSNKLGIYKVS